MLLPKLARGSLSVGKHCGGPGRWGRQRDPEGESIIKLKDYKQCREEDILMPWKAVRSPSLGVQEHRSGEGGLGSELGSWCKLWKSGDLVYVCVCVLFLALGIYCFKNFYKYLMAG